MRNPTQPPDDPFWKARIIPNLIAVGFVILVVLLAYWNATATAQAATIQGRCGLHRGTAVAVHPPLLPDRWHVRIGPKTARGRLMCLGHYKRRAGKASSVSFTWQPFLLPNWNWSGILGTGAEAAGTGAACIAFGTALVGELPSGLFDTAMTVATGAGCVAGWKDLTDKAPHDDPNVVFPFRPVH